MHRNEADGCGGLEESGERETGERDTERERERETSGGRGGGGVSAEAAAEGVEQKNVLTFAFKIKPVCFHEKQDT